MTTSLPAEQQVSTTASDDASTSPLRAIAPSPARRIAIVLVLGGLSAFAPLSMDMYLPALPAMAEDLVASTSAVQLTLTTCLIGLATGQLLSGPLSDTFGRRRPLLAGLGIYVVASLLCTVAPSVESLIVLRLIQGAAGSAGIVIARAIVRDLYSGNAVARFFASLLLITGVAPMLAPVIGGQVLRVTSWRGIFVVLALFGVFLLVGVLTSLPETLPVKRRRPAGLGPTLESFRTLLRDRRFLGFALPIGLAYAAMFAYISGSSFVLQDVFGASPQTYSVIFAINALGLVLAAQVAGRLVNRFGPARLLPVGLTINVAGGVGLLVAILFDLGLPGVLPALFTVVASVGFISPNATALALANYPRNAGSASGVLGVAQFAFGAAAAPLVGIAGSHTALPMALVISTLSIGASILYLALAGTARAQTER